MDMKTINKDEQNVWGALQPIHDPELAASIVDLGLIYAVRVEGKEAHITMTFTTPLCPFGQSLVEQIRKAVRGLGMTVKVDITFDPPWNLEKIKPELREQFLFPQDVL